jgi:hypothetical protein
VSGFDGVSDHFGLTPTKARFWHRHSEADCHGGIAEDLRSVGLTVIEHKTWWEVFGPGVDGDKGLHGGGAGPIWTALSGLSDGRS